MASRNLKIALLQRVCTSYRLNLFKRLSSSQNLEVKVFFGENIPNSKVQSTNEVNDICHSKLQTKHFQFKNIKFQLHIGLITALKEYNPDIILCEGESNFLSYLKALYYRRLNKNVRLIHWSLGGLPGETNKTNSPRKMLKSWLFRGVDAFFVYSSFGKKCLTALGAQPQKIRIINNVSDTKKHLNLYHKVKLSQPEARQHLNLPNRFTILYVGAMESDKRPSLLIDLACALNKSKYHIVMLGDGILLDQLKREVSHKKLTNICLPGRQHEKLPLYFRSANVLLVPGRGGMVISEAMAHALPVIVHQADGTEYDLVENNVTGIHLNAGESKDFLETIKFLKNNPEIRNQLGQNGQRKVMEKFNMETMVEQMKSAFQELSDELSRK